MDSTYKSRPGGFAVEHKYITVQSVHCVHYMYNVYSVMCIGRKQIYVWPGVTTFAAPANSVQVREL